MAKQSFPIAVEVQETYSEKAERSFIPTGAQSLMESLRQNLPDEDGPDRLVFLVTRQPGLYATLLGKLIAGSSFKAAAISVGVSIQQITYWLQQGSSDLADDVDSYCSRLLLDCQRAQAMSVGDAEERVHKNNPERWLAKGTAKDFHKGKYWQDQIPRMSDDPSLIQQESTDPLDPPPIRAIEDHSEEDDNTEEQLQEALKVLEDHNIITNPEFVKQAREQFKLPKPEDK